MNTNKYLQSKGPLLLAVNHPNSLLDAVILSTIFKRPIHSLARGDVFKKPFFAKLLRSMNMHPVYRLSEGVENIEHNYTSFEACRNIFKKNGIVLIFSEGRCENEWHLRPLMKGTARLALSAWEEGIDLKILPIGINYHSFISFGKNVHINFGETIIKEDLKTKEGYGKKIADFNNLLQMQLEKLVYEIDPNEIEKIKNIFQIKLSSLSKKILFLPAMLGKILHWPLYYFVQKFACKKVYGTGHYDSLIVGLLFLTYPLYLLSVFLIVFILMKSWWAILVFLFPLFAWSYVQLKQLFFTHTNGSEKL